MANLHIQTLAVHSGENQKNDTDVIPSIHYI